MTRRRVLAAAIALAAALVTGVDRLDACLADFVIIPVHSVRPGEAGAFLRGDVGVVPPTYARVYLVAAYRRFVGLPMAGIVAPASDADGEAVAAWIKLRRQAVDPRLPASAAGTIDQWRATTQFQNFLNCGDDAFVVAARTLEDRIRHYGSGSTYVADWIRAQDAVFKNCHDTPVTLPSAVPAGADPVMRADRAYQTAAAMFYATEYGAAADRFRAIAADPSSPWRSYGHLLAGRALMRQAAVSLEASAGPDADTANRRADAELALAESDQSVPATLRASATGLRHALRARLDPIGRLHDVSSMAMRDGAWTFQDATDFAVLFNHEISDESSYDYDTLPNRDALTHDDDLLDWIVTLQGRGDAAGAHALSQWKQKASTPWLVASLWKTPGSASDAPALLAAAAAVPRSSPAFATVAFLRVRLLDRHARPEAVRVLATLPDRPGPGLPMETINLFRALRLRAANSLDAWLAAAPRWSVTQGMGFADATPTRRPSEMTLDQDAARALTEQFPLDRLVDAVARKQLTPRLRLLLAGAAWTRALEFGDDAAGVRLAPALEGLSPKLGPELERYRSAPDAEARRHRALLLVLRWPTFRNYVPLADWAPGGAFLHFTGPAPIGAFEMRSVWWCGFDAPSYMTTPGPYEERPVTRLQDFVPGTPAPAFLTAADRAQAKSEWTRLAALGAAPNYLTREAIAWAKARPDDADVPEALARAVQATQTSCTDKQTGPLSHEAFDLLHQRYAGTAWAKKTKFWYAGAWWQ